MSVGLDIRIVARGFGPRRDHVVRRLRSVLDDHGLADYVELERNSLEPIAFATDSTIGVSRGVELMERLGEALRAMARYGLVIDFFWRTDFEDGSPWVQQRYIDGAQTEVPASAHVATPTRAVQPDRRGPLVHRNQPDDPRSRWPCYRVIDWFEEAHGPAEIGAPVDARGIAALEKAIGALVPLDYREFVEAWGHVRVGPLAVYGVAIDPTHPADVRAANRQLVDEIRDYCRRDPERTSAEYRTNMYPILSCGDARYVLDVNGDVCRYDIESDRLNYAPAPFAELLAALTD